MFKNKWNGRNNISGVKIETLRTNKNLSQRKLADIMQIEGIDLDKNAIQRIESGKRFVTDIELKIFAKVFEVTVDALLEYDGKHS